jgi:hypothetical protein
MATLRRAALAAQRCESRDQTDQGLPQDKPAVDQTDSPPLAAAGDERTPSVGDASPDTRVDRLEADSLISYGTGILLAARKVNISKLRWTGNRLFFQLGKQPATQIRRLLQVLASGILLCQTTLHLKVES